MPVSEISDADITEALRRARVEDIAAEMFRRVEQARALVLSCDREAKDETNMTRLGELAAGAVDGAERARRYSLAMWALAPDTARAADATRMSTDAAQASIRVYARYRLVTRQRRGAA
jgi:ADP-ribose pyrophosphatase YjhB (NUDIX family)